MDKTQISKGQYSASGVNIVPDFKWEEQHTGIIAGVDEVGRGSWAGPVVAAAIIIDREKFPQQLLNDIDDSKLLTSQKREQVAAELHNLQGHACEFTLGQASVAEVDQINIREASLLAMQRAVEALPIIPEVTLVDGHIIPDLTCHAIPIIRGDSASYSIAAASVIAKVARDRLMKELAAEHPFYGWERNAGYGTKQHQIALTEHGVTPHHRRSFSPIKKLIEAI